MFETTYNARGQVESVVRTYPTPEVPIVTYTYGTSGITNGMVVSVVDELSGAIQDIDYYDLSLVS